MLARIKISVVLFFLITGNFTSAYALSPAIQITSSIEYYVSTSGNDANPGTESAPWLTMQKALNTAMPGDTVFIRSGQYNGIKGGWVFKNSGTASLPITITNYPGEQVIFKITAASDIDRNIFRCSINPTQPTSWHTPKADFIRIIGTDVSSRILPNGIASKKGIVMLGMEGEQSAAIIASDCDHWEVAGVDFIETAYGIFTLKNNWHLPEEHSTDHWYVHDNRVYNYYRESGMQFDGNFNLVENNEIYKVSNRLDTPYNCQMLNLLGNNNIVRGNILSRMGSKAICTGILFEWDLSDANQIENNRISDVLVGISFQGGDNNLIQNNVILASANTNEPGVLAGSYNNQTTWPCDDYVNSGSSAEALIPPNDPSHPDYQYYYNPRNCHSMNNRIINNTISGFPALWRMYPVQENSNIFSNNTTNIVEGVDSKVIIGGAELGSYTISNNNTLLEEIPNFAGGPVRIRKADGAPIVFSERVMFSFGGVLEGYYEMMGLPSQQLSTEYWYPYNTNVGVNTQLRFGNAGSTTANIEVRIAGNLVGTYSVEPNSVETDTFYNVVGGPVSVRSTNGIPIISTQRFIFTTDSVNPTSFAETMGMPAEQADSEYWFPIYNNLTTNSEIRISNIGNSTANVNIYMGGTKQGSTINIPVNTTHFVSFPGLAAGPVRIVSTNGVKIVVTERVLFSFNGVNTSYYEMMALPLMHMSTEYWYPYNTNSGVNTQIRFGNAGSTTANVEVRVAGNLIGTYSVAPNSVGTETFYNIEGGPVQVRSTNGIPLISTQRFIFTTDGINPTSFAETMGMPLEELSDEFWLPIYNNLTTNSQFRIGYP